MSKSMLFILSVLLGTLLLITTAGSQEEMEVVDNRVFKKPQRVSAVFQHDAHNEAAGIEECQECHHIYESGNRVEDESSEDQACVDCHALTPSGRTLALRNAYHTNCKGCHMKSAAGPVMCGECHVKR